MSTQDLERIKDRNVKKERKRRENDAAIQG